MPKEQLAGKPAAHLAELAQIRSVYLTEITTKSSIQSQSPNEQPAVLTAGRVGGRVLETHKVCGKGCDQTAVSSSLQIFIRDHLIVPFK